MKATVATFLLISMGALVLASKVKKHSLLVEDTDASSLNLVEGSSSSAYSLAEEVANTK